jgi:hypothetical protein
MRRALLWGVRGFGDLRDIGEGGRVKGGERIRPR